MLHLGLPYLVAELEGRIVGYSYATSYRTRPADRYTVEDSGFVPAGNLVSVGFKLGRWVDSVLMQRSLGAGHSSKP